MNQKVHSAIDKLFLEFIDKISNECKINKQKLVDIYMGHQHDENDEKVEHDEDELKVIPPETQVSKKTSTSEVAKPKATPKKESGQSLEALKKIAKELGIQGFTKFKSSDKEELQRLIDERKEKGAPVKETKVVEKKEIPTKQQLAEKIQARTQSIVIKKNKFGNYEHQGTRLVLDPNTKKAIGVQSDDGKIIPLTMQDIQKCEDLNFDYELPGNLAQAGAKKVEKEVDEDDLYDEEEEDDLDDVEEEDEE